MTETIRKTLRMLPARLRRRWLWLLPPACISAVLEMIGTAGVLGLVQLIADPSGEQAARVVQAMRTAVPGGDETTLTAAFALALGLFYAVKNAVRFAEAYLQARCAGATMTYLHGGLLERYLRAPYPFHLGTDSAELIQRAESGASTAGHVVLFAAIGLVSETLVVGGMLAVVVWRTPPGAVIAASALGVVLALLIWLTQRRHTRWGLRLHELATQGRRLLHQTLTAVREVKTLGRERFFAEANRDVRVDEQRVIAKRQAVEAAPRLAVETVFVIGLGALFLAARGAAANSAETAATLGVLAYAGLRLLPSLHLIVYRFNRVGQGTALVDRISEDWERLAGALNKPEPPPLPLHDSIALCDVGYRYPGAERDALVGVTLEIRRGESIGLVGPTGSGKSTLADLLVGLLAPTSGEIRIDGRPLEPEPRGWQLSVGYVPQAVHLLDDSLRRNIALGLSEEEIDEGFVAEAVAQAQLQDVVARLPRGLDEPMGEAGVKLSGGERQRVAVARALYRRPALLLLDEATASLDNRTEKALTDTLEALRGERTMVLIAHRLSTVERCDRLIFLLDGRVADIGSYAELRQRNKRFREMALTDGGLN